MTAWGVDPVWQRGVSDDLDLEKEEHFTNDRVGCKIGKQHACGVD